MKWSPKTPLQVITYAGYRGEQEPRALILGGTRYDVLGIDDRWHDPRGRYFRVAVDDGRVYLLRCEAAHATWSIVNSWTLDA